MLPRRASPKRSPSARSRRGRTEKPRTKTATETRLRRRRRLSRSPRPPNRNRAGAAGSPSKMEQRVLSLLPSRLIALPCRPQRVRGVVQGAEWGPPCRRHRRRWAAMGRKPWWGRRGWVGRRALDRRRLHPHARRACRRVRARLGQDGARAVGPARLELQFEGGEPHRFRVRVGRERVGQHGARAGHVAGEPLFFGGHEPQNFGLTE